MKSIILVVSALVAIAFAAPVEDKDATVLLNENEMQPDGNYKTAVEISNGIKLQQVGTLKEVIGEDNKPHTVIIISGEYSYNDPEGNPVLVKYVADEKGYSAEGASIPKVEDTKNEVVGN